VALMGFAPARIDNRLFIFGGMAAVIYANWLMLGYSPAMDQRLVVAATLLQGTGLGMLLPSLGKVAFSALDPKFRPEGTALLSLSRVYGSTIGIAVVQIFFYNNTQAMHLALAKNLTPYRAAAHVAGSIAKPRSCRAQWHDHPAGGGCRSHRPVQDPDARHADREPARAVSPQAAFRHSHG
jgi:DHA2 family multidrug resistance protein